MPYRRGKTQTMLDFSLHGEEGKKKMASDRHDKKDEENQIQDRSGKPERSRPHQQAEEGEAGHTDKYMVEGRNHKHQNEPNQMSDTDIMVNLSCFTQETPDV